MYSRVVFTVLLTIWLSGGSLGQQGVIVDQTDDARFYMAYILHFNSTESEFPRVYIACAGVFIKGNYVLTAASCVHGFHRNVTVPRFGIYSGVLNVSLSGSGRLHWEHKISIHPNFDPQNPLENNIALIEVDNRMLENVKHTREIGEITPNRFCTVLGWEGFDYNQLNPIPLQMFAVPIVNSTFCSGDVYCTRDISIESKIANCGGLRGAPVFCGDGKLSGIVVRDNFC